MNPSLGLSLGNSVLDEIDRARAQLSPAAQQAVAMGNQIAKAAPGGGAPANTGVPAAEAPVRPIAAPGVKPPPALAGSQDVPRGTPGVSQPVSPAIAPLSPTEQGHKAELSRLTAPPIQGMEHTHASTGQSGINQIHSPWARIPLQVLEAVGSGFFPAVTAAIPGTQLHHNVLVNQAEGNVANDEGQRAAAAKEKLEAAQTQNFESEAANRGQGEFEPVKYGEGVLNKKEGKITVPPIKPPEKLEPLKPNEGVFGSETGNVVIPPTEVQRETLPPLIAKAFGLDPSMKVDPGHLPAYLNSFAAIQRDQNKTPEAQVAERTQIADQLKLQGRDRLTYIAEGKIEPPEHPPQALMANPATGLFERETPGSKVPPGALTPQQLGSQNVPTAQTRSMAEVAPKVLELADRVGKLVDQQAKSLGPAGSRWSEFMSGKVGAPNPDFTKLRTDVGLLQTALMRMHVGARGGEQMMEHFRDLIDTSKQSPENLKAALEEIVSYAQDVQKSGKTNTPPPEANHSTANPKVLKYNPATGKLE